MSMPKSTAVQLNMSQQRTTKRMQRGDFTSKSYAMQILHQLPMARLNSTPASAGAFLQPPSRHKSWVPLDRLHNTSGRTVKVAYRLTSIRTFKIPSVSFLALI
jgi:hypothetical protein